MNNSNVGIHSFLPHIHTFRSPHVQPSPVPLSQPSLALHAHVQTSPVRFIVMLSKKVEMIPVDDFDVVTFDTDNQEYENWGLDHSTQSSQVLLYAKPWPFYPV